MVAEAPEGGAGDPSLPDSEPELEGLGSHTSLPNGNEGSSGDGRGATDYFDALFTQVLGVLDYPRRARLEEVEGTVVLDLRIDREGRIDEMRVLESSGSSLLDRHALRIAQRAAPFGPVPATVDERELRFELPLEFTLTD
jgi:protein TonB